MQTYRSLNLAIWEFNGRSQSSITPISHASPGYRVENSVICQGNEHWEIFNLPDAKREAPTFAHTVTCFGSYQYQTGATSLVAVDLRATVLHLLRLYTLSHSIQVTSESRPIASINICRPRTPGASDNSLTSTMSLPPDASISTTSSLAYWSSIPTTVTGMLGGLPQFSRIDLRGSATFLAKLRREHPCPTPGKTLPRGVDCGAGIGRITAGFLSTVCDVVDVVEPIEKFAQEAKGAKMSGQGAVGQVFVTGLEDWRPVERYDLIWVQWCVGHLTDRQSVGFLRRCKEVVNVGGWIVVKENLSTDLEGKDVYDEVDSSVTRTDGKFRGLFKEAGVRVVKTEVQKGFPKYLLPVRLYALTPE